MKLKILLIVFLVSLLGCNQSVTESSVGIGIDCTTIILEKYNLTNEMKDTKDLAYMMMITVDSYIHYDFIDYIEENNVSDITLRAYVDILEC